MLSGLHHGRLSSEAQSIRVHMKLPVSESERVQATYLYVKGQDVFSPQYLNTYQLLLLHVVGVSEGRRDLPAKAAAEGESS